MADRASGKIAKKIPLSGHPNNISVTKDGGRVVVGIADDPGALDVIDTQSLKVAGRTAAVRRSRGSAAPADLLHEVGFMLARLGA